MAQLVVRNLDDDVKAKLNAALEEFKGVFKE